MLFDGVARDVHGLALHGHLSRELWLARCRASSLRSHLLASAIVLPNLKTGVGSELRTAGACPPGEDAPQAEQG